jgi:hypothetical protein
MVRSDAYTNAIHIRFWLCKLDGDIDERVRGVLKAIGLEVVLWNADTQDWTLTVNVPEYIDTVIKNPPAKGVLSLQHDLDTRAAENIPTVVKQVMDSGRYELYTVSECTGKGSPYLEIDVKAPTRR